MSIEHVVKSEIGTIFVKKKYLKNILSRFMKLILIFMSIIKKIQVDNNDQEYILFRIDIYFTEYFLAVEIDEKGHTDRDLIFEEKRQKALEKNLTVNLLELILVEKIMMQTIKLVEYKRFLVTLIKTK